MGVATVSEEQDNGEKGEDWFTNVLQLHGNKKCCGTSAQDGNYR